MDVNIAINSSELTIGKLKSVLQDIAEMESELKKKDLDVSIHAEVKSN